MPIPRTLFNEDHEAFRDTVRKFCENEIVPHTERWETQQHVDRDIWTKAGEAGFLNATMPEEYGGSEADKLYSAIAHHASDELKQTYLPKMATGEMIGAIAMTEPAAGSDLQGVKTTAIKNGDHYVLNGSKTFITNGYLCDLVIVVAKTDPAAGAKGTSLFVVDTSMAGFTKSASCT